MTSSNIRTNTLSCSFCLNLKIPLPHDHMVRDLTKSSKPIVCPKLLEVECSYCHNKGHTVAYCLVLKSKKQNPSIVSRNVRVSSNVKRNSPMDSDGFTYIYPQTSNKETNQYKNNKIQKVGILTTSFGALDVEDYNSGSESSSDEILCSNSSQIDELTQSVPYVSSPPIWSNIVANGKIKKKEVPHVMSNVDNIQELKEKLGLHFTSRWGDLSDDE